MEGWIVGGEEDAKLGSIVKYVASPKKCDQNLLDVCKPESSGPIYHIQQRINVMDVLPAKSKPGRPKKALNPDPLLALTLIPRVN